MSTGALAAEERQHASQSANAGKKRRAVTYHTFFFVAARRRRPWRRARPQERSKHKKKAEQEPTAAPKNKRTARLQRLKVIAGPMLCCRRYVRADGDLASTDTSGRRPGMTVGTLGL